MKIPIEIKIKDVNAFAYFAFILDQDEFINDTLKLREYWELEEKLIPWKEFYQWTNAPHYDFELTPKAADFWAKAKDKIQNELKNDDAKIKELAYSNPMELEIEYLIKKNGINAKFKELIWKSVVCGQIKNEDVQTANDSFYHSSWILDFPEYEKTYKGDTKQEIKRDRKWYWLHRNEKKTIPELAKKYKPEWMKSKDEEIKYRNTIKQAIKRYKAFLKRVHL